MTCRVSPGDGGSATKAARDKGREGSQTSVGTVYVRPASSSRQERDTWSGPATVRPRGGGGLWVCRARQNAFLDLAAPRMGRGGEEAVQRARAMRPAAPASTPAHPHPGRVGGESLSASVAATSWVRSTPSARPWPWASWSVRKCPWSARNSVSRSCAWGRRYLCASARPSPLAPPTRPARTSEAEARRSWSST